MQRAKQDLNDGLYIGIIGAIIACVLFCYLEITEIWTFAIPSTLLPAHGVLLNSTIRRWIEVDGWAITLAYAIGSFLILVYSAFMAALFFFIWSLIEGSPSLGFAALIFLFSMLFGFIPSLVTGIVYGAIKAVK